MSGFQNVIILVLLNGFKENEYPLIFPGYLYVVTTAGITLALYN